MVLSRIIVYFGILIIALYACKKILNVQNVPYIKIVTIFAFSCMVAVLASYMQIFNALIFFTYICIIVSFTAKVKTSYLVTVVVVSIGISMGIEILSSVILALIHFTIELAYIFVREVWYDIPADGILLFSLTDLHDHVFLIPPLLWDSMSVFVSIVLTIILFRIKRLKNGFVFMQNKTARLTGVVLGIIIMVSRSTFGIINEFIKIEEIGDLLALAPFVLTMFVVILICTLGIFFWWRYNTTKVYQERLKERIIQEYKTEIEEKDRQIKIISQCNEFFAITIHRDNKLIPAMYNAVSAFLEDRYSGITPEAKEKGLRLLGELNEVMQERKAMISKIERENKPLTVMGIERIDYILSYMQQKAIDNGIQFDFVMAGSGKKITENVISKQKLETLLADLIENAIIATFYSDYKKVLVIMGVVDNFFEIAVQDSGIPFEIETLTNLGLKKSTTHADEGGKGIGYLTVFEILKESSASLTITEYTPESYASSKSVKVRFDGKSEFIIHSHRAEEIKRLTDREDMLVPG